MARLTLKRRRGHGLARMLACAGAAALLHLILLTGLDPRAEAALPPSGAKPVSVRTLPDDSAWTRTSMPAVDPAAASPAPRAVGSSLAAKPPPMRPATKRVQAPPEKAPVALLAATTPDASAADAPAPAQEAHEAEEPVPTYATRIPPSFSYHYDMSRGPISGLGSLTWSRDASGYRLRLTGEVPLFGSLLKQESVGAFDAHGLAPERFTDQRLGRAAQAANFQRQAGKITFSGPATEFPLVPGTQDRLSWMVQLAAIAEADPAVGGAGHKVSLYVVGARGEANVWTFLSSGLQQVNLAGHAVQAVKLVREPREPRKPHDTLAEVWLDPARHHLPVRARLSESGGGEALELVLQAGD